MYVIRSLPWSNSRPSSTSSIAAADASVIRRREAHCCRRSTQPVQMALDGERTGMGYLERLENAIADHETMVGGGYRGGALTFVAHPVDPHRQVRADVGAAEF